METLIRERKSIDAKELALVEIEELIDGATTEDELTDLEEMVGVVDFLKWSKGWEDLAYYLRDLGSIYSSFYFALNDRWEEIEGAE